ncbi:DciA family protein [Dankookia sp. P2]|uniref:DciA family protein n=1 Tax=Dankookia sp. P2 TaxID=3423955 RepID=UPI003D668B04
MAKDSDKAGGFIPARSPYGPRPLGALIPALTKPVFRKRSPAGAQLMADWPGVVGPALAAVTTPLRFAAGTLTIACAGPVAMELTHLAPQLIARINAHLGKPMVERLRFVQQALSRPRRWLGRPPMPPPRPGRAGRGQGSGGGIARGAGKARPGRLSGSLLTARRGRSRCQTPMEAACACPAVPCSPPPPSRPPRWPPVPRPRTRAFPNAASATRAPR